jgi:hypothetical protein
MTDIRTGGVAREALVSSPGDVRLGGVVREALVAGTGITGRAFAKSGAVAALTITAFAGNLLLGTAGAQSGARCDRLAVSISLVAHAGSMSRARAGLPSSTTLAGRITAMSAAHMAPLSLTVVTGRSGSRSSGRASATVATVGAGQDAVTVNVG